MLSTILFQFFSMLQLQITAAQDEKHEACSQPSSPTAAATPSASNMMEYLVAQDYMSPRNAVAAERRSALWSKVANITEACFEQVDDG